MSEDEHTIFSEIIKNSMGDFLPADNIALNELNVLAHGLAKQGRQTKYRSFCYATNMGMLSMSKEDDDNNSLLTVSIFNPYDTEDCIAEVVFDEFNSIKSLQVDKDRSEDALAVLSLSMLEEGFNESERYAIMGLNQIFKASMQSYEELEDAVNSYSNVIAKEAKTAVERLSFGEFVIYKYDYSIDENTTLHVGMNKSINQDNDHEGTKYEQIIVDYTDTLRGNEYSLYTDEDGESMITVSKIGEVDLQNDVLSYIDMSVGTVAFLKNVLIDTILKDL